MALKFLKNKSLLAIVTNSIKGGDNFLFKNLYARNQQGEEIDILEDGKNSCAVFVSWILLALEMVKKPHATVEGVEKDLAESGWYEIKELRPGAVLVWESKVGQFDGLLHRHAGFFVGNDEAISNDTASGFPRRHHVTYGDSRKIEKIYWHPDLDE